MEQPGMMPNGMGGGNNMNMVNPSMQRPQNGNSQQQLHALIMEHLRASLQQMPPGWQQTFDIRERASRIMQMVTMLRNLDNSMQKCLSIAENWEVKIITQCQSKEHYFAQWDQKFAEITRKRQMQASQNGLGMPQQNNMGNMHNMGMPQNGGMNGMNGTGGMGMNNFSGMGMNMPNAGMGMPNQMNMGQQGGFPQQLQRQMQPSPMPPQNQQQPQNGSIDPSALTRNPQMQSHMPNQVNQPHQQQHQQRQHQQNMNPGQGGPPNGPSDNEVKQLARRMHDSTPEEQKNQLRAQFLSNMSEQQRQQARQQNFDPLARFFMQRARTNLLKARQQGGQNGMGMAMGANMQQNPSQSGQQPNFDFSSMMGQQANAIKSQESGGEVVPASNHNNNNNNNNNSSSSSSNNNNNNNNMMQQGGNNQQQMMNFGQNGGANPQMANNMQFAAMQEKQKREQMARQNHMAKQQALAQQNQLRGQPGGLNAPNALNGGQVNSPAMNMNMLNRPTFPPGQTTPSTPHQNQSMHGQPPQTPSTGANQLQQHHQNMLNQNQMGHDSLHRQFLDNLAPESRAKLATLNPDQVNQLMQKFAAQRQSAMAPPGGQPNGQNMGMNMGGQPMHNQGMMGNAVPGFNSQPPPNQQGHMEPQAGLHQKLQQQQNAQLKQKAMDSRPFPKQVLQTLSLSVPEHVNSWGKLRQHIVQNQSVLPQELMGKLSAMQNQWFDTHPEELKAAVENIKRMIHAQNVQRQGQQGGPQGMPMPNGQAPQAQMVAPPAQMQQRPPSQAPDNVPQEHINKIREKWPQARNMTDDQIREQMRKTRANQMQQHADMQQQQNLKNAQMSANMQRAQQMMGNGGQQNQQSGPQRQTGQQAQGQGQKRGISDDVVEIPNPNAQAVQQQQPPQMQQGQQQNQQQGNVPHMPNVAGLKTREELMAMPAEQREAYKRKMLEIQALRKAQIGIGASQPNGPQQQMQPQGQEQQQVAQQAQHQQPPQNGTQNQPPPNVQQELYKIKGIYAQVQNEFTKGPEVQLNQPQMQKAQELLRKLWPIAQTLDKTLLAGHRAFSEDRIKEAIKIKHIILQNAADANGTIKDYLGVNLETLVYFERFIGEYLKELKARQQAQNQPQPQGGQVDAGKQAQANAQPAAHQPRPAQQQQGKQTPSTTQQQKGQAPPPLNRKNSSQHTRKASQNKAPPAPTDDTKKFDWSGTPTPHGVPKYDSGRTELTADKLKFPPPKKRKTTDSQSSTPAAQTGTPASPQVTSGPKRESPEQVRKMPPAPMPEPEKPRFSCEEAFCFASAATQGFESEEALRKHVDEEHKAIEDPFKFLIETVDQGLMAMGVDENVVKLPQQKSKSQTAARRPPPAQKVADRKAAAATVHATPALKAESATPATPASAGGRRAGVAATPVGKKAGEAVAKNQVHGSDKTLYDSLGEQLGVELSVDQPTAAAPTAAGAAGAVEEDPFLFSLSEALGPNPTPTNHFSSAMDLDEPFDFDAWSTNDFSGLDLGVPREPLALTAFDSDASPQLTPSSSITSQSTGEINISEAQRLKMVFEWDPSGNGDTAVPEKLRKMALDNGSEDGGTGEGDKWNWSGDGATWEEIFGMDVDGDNGFAAAFGGT